MGAIGNFLWFHPGWRVDGPGLVDGGRLGLITVVGIPFGSQHLKLAGIALAPIGKSIVAKEVAAAGKQDAQASVARLPGGA